MAGGFRGGGGGRSFWRSSGGGSGASKPSDGGGGDNVSRAAAASRYISPDSSYSSLTQKVGEGEPEEEEEEDWILSVPPHRRCPGLVRSMEKMVKVWGPDRQSLQNCWKNIADCPNLPPSVAEIGIHISRKESLMKSSESTEKRA